MDLLAADHVRHENIHESYAEALAQSQDVSEEQKYIENCVKRLRSSVYSLVEAQIGKRLESLKRFNYFFRDQTPILSIELMRIGLQKTPGEQRREMNSSHRQGELFWRLGEFVGAVLGTESSVDLLWSCVDLGRLIPGICNSVQLLPARNFLRASAPFLIPIIQKLSPFKSLATSGVSNSVRGYGAEFLTTDQQERFTSVKIKVCGNKAVDVADLPKNGMGSIIAAMERMKWSKMATLLEVSYPDLVKAFYVCLKTEEDGSLTSTVKGTQIKITYELLESLFGVCTIGHSGIHTVDIQAKWSATFSTCTKADSDMMFWAIQNQSINMAEVMIARMKFASTQNATAHGIVFMAPLVLVDVCMCAACRALGKHAGVSKLKATVEYVAFRAQFDEFSPRGRYVEWRKRRAGIVLRVLHEGSKEFGVIRMMDFGLGFVPAKATTLGIATKSRHRDMSCSEVGSPRFCVSQARECSGLVPVLGTDEVLSSSWTPSLLC
ncbi:hypothetical protein Taro_020235 [Colocasia esculenta]|uniref:Uncharacterized protein n=1 Tax=Colocasia esculenta TaxID=4460 RepID=A0A843V1R8_COLES|nr:hypothetical protein [Colocasia esculenta]